MEQKNTIKIKLITIIIPILLIVGAIGVGIYISKNDKAVESQNMSSNNTQNIEADEKEIVKLNKIYTNFTNSKKLNSVDIGMYNEENKQYFKVLSIDLPDCYLVSDLYYIDGPGEFSGYNYKKYDNYSSMKSIVNDIPNIIGNEMISKISVSDYVDASVDEATVLRCELYSKLNNTFEYSDKTVYNGKNIYYGYGKNSILGPTVSGIIIIEGNETASERNNKYLIKTEDTLRINFRLSNPEINENNYNEYMKELLNNIEFYK